MTEEIDIVSALSGYTHLFDIVFTSLDVRSLARAETVCRRWQEAILHRKIWKKTLLPKLMKLPTWPKLADWVNISSLDDDAADLKKKWVAYYNQSEALCKNWQTATFTAEEKIISQVSYFTMNSTHFITTDGDVIKFWNRKTLICEKEFIEKGRNVVSLDCDDTYLITAADVDCTGSNAVTSIVCRSLKTNEIIYRVVEGRQVPITQSWGCHEALFKVRFRHNFLVSHRLLPMPGDDQLERGTTSYLTLRKFNDSEKTIDANGITRSLLVDANVAYPTFIGHDDKYVVVHYHDPPRFELISPDTSNIIRTIDSLDNCRSVQYGNGLIVSASAQMGTHTRTSCVIRLWDVETGHCIREIVEPESSRYHNLGHQVAFNSSFLVSVPDLPNRLPRILKIRDFRAALDPNTPSDKLLLATHTLDWAVSTWDSLLLDEFQIAYFHDPTYEPSSLFVFSLISPLPAT